MEEKYKSETMRESKMREGGGEQQEKVKHKGAGKNDEKR